MSEEEFQVYLESQMFREKGFRDYEKAILEVYKKNRNRKLNMAAVYDYLEERYGVLPGNEQTLRNFIRYLNSSNKLQFHQSSRIYQKVPQLPFGKQMQLDFGQYRMDSGLILYIFAALLSASRYHYIIFQDHPFSTGEVIEHLLCCFDYFGGTPKELVIDRTAYWSSVKMPGISSIPGIFSILSRNRISGCMSAGKPILKLRARWKT